MRFEFKGLCSATGKWRTAYADIPDDRPLAPYVRVDRVTGIAPIESLSRWKDSNELTGAMINFCTNKGCPICKEDEEKE